jgi:hypothetical protein
VAPVGLLQKDNLVKHEHPNALAQDDQDSLLSGAFRLCALQVTSKLHLVQPVTFLAALNASHCFYEP